MMSAPAAEMEALSARLNLGAAPRKRVDDSVRRHPFARAGISGGSEPSRIPSHA